MNMESGSRHNRDFSQEDLQLEEQPFLATAGEAQTRTVRSRSAKPTSRWQLTVFVLLVVITVFGLVLIPFSIKFDASIEPQKGKHGHGGDMHDMPQHGGEDEHGHDDSHEKPEPEHKDEHEKPDTHPVTSTRPDEFPKSPKLRDLSEYVLNSTWSYDAAPTTREYHWTIVNAELNPDGIYRPMILINNQFPGPLVECNEGDTILVHVENKAVNSTALHFHGLFQNGTNFMDGTVGVTQCPIAPNSKFTYKFQVKGQSGTYWYHAHHSAQASDGLVGPVVVHSKDERKLQKLDYDTDRVVMVQDHYHNLTSELLMEYLQPDMENDEPVPDNALVNGRGVRDCADFPGWHCDSSKTSPPTLELAPNKRHRLRFINTGAFAEFQIQFDEHTFAVTEVDGTDVYPATFHRLNILPGQRYSVVLETNVTTADSFWIRNRMVSHCFTTKNKRLETELHGILRYTGSPKAKDEPTTKNWPEPIEVICRDLDITNLHPVLAEELPAATDNLTVHASFRIGDWRLSRGHFNEHTWHMNATSPSLHRFLDSSSAPTTRDDDDSNTTSHFLAANTALFNIEDEYVMQTNSTRILDLTINNYDDGSHPFHLHGHKFYVLVIGEKGYAPPAHEIPEYLRKNNLGKNPLRRDTVTVEGYGWAIIRIVLDNPGLWALHCHNNWHADAGMLMQFLVRDDEVRKQKLDDSFRAMCKLPNVESGMRPDDGLWFGHFDK